MARFLVPRPLRPGHGLRGLLPLAVLLIGCLVEAAQEPPAGAIQGERAVPLTTVTFEGRRYVASVDLGLGEPVPLMVHGNAGLFLSLTHRAGAQVVGRPVEKVADYGYSSRGRGAITVPLLSVGGMRFENLKSVPVFDFAEEGDTPVQGMLGVAFLIASRAAVDFTRDELILGVAAAESPNRELLDRGYKCVPMAVSAGNRVTVEVAFPILGRTLRITPSTVANALTLHQPLFEGKATMKKESSQDLSPNRTSPDLYSCDRVDFEIAGTKLWSPARFEDFAEYWKVSEAELETFGMLGFDWMKARGAILDYSNRRLYFKP